MVRLRAEWPSLDARWLVRSMRPEKRLVSREIRIAYGTDGRMIVTPIADHGIDFLASDLVRSPGLHASDIYGDLYKHLEPKRYDFGDEPPNPVLMALGTAWENHLEYLLLKAGYKIERPGEFFSPPPESIAFSPDLIQENGVLRLWEIKLTSMSATTRYGGEVIVPGNVLPAKFAKYQTQMMLYAKWLGIYDGMLAVVFLYKPFDPQFRLVHLHWNDRELEENERMCMNHMRHMREAAKKGTR